VRWLARRIGLALLFVALVGVTLRPHFGRFPSDPGDPAFVAWAMSWTGHAIVHAPRHILDANIFWPRHAALAYSDLLTPIVPVYLAFHALTGSWETSIALTEYALLVFGVAATFWLARWITGRSEAAVFAAIAFGLNGYVLAQYSHVQMYALGFVALSFLLLFRLLEYPSTGRAVALAFGLAATLYAALYYGLIVAVGVVVAVLVVLATQRAARNRTVLRSLAIAAVVTGVLIAPAAVAYTHAQHVTGFHRGIDPQWGLRARDLVTPAPGSYLLGSLAHRNVPADAEHRFFAGFTTYALATFGLLGLAFHRAKRDKYALVLVAAGVAALVLALGPVVAGHKAPFWLFHDHVPGFGALRAVARFAVVTLLAVAVLAAVGLTRLTEGVSRRGRVVLCTVACAVLLAELAAPLRWASLRHDRATLAVYRELRRLPGGAVAELPMADHGSPPGAWAGTEARRMLFSTLDWKPRVNGYSGLNPKGYARDAAMLNTFPSDAALARLRVLRVRYVVWHPTGGVLARPLPALPPTLTAEPYGDAFLIRVS
jgi:hypothetical protein